MCAVGLIGVCIHLLKSLRKATFPFHEKAVACRERSKILYNLSIADIIGTAMFLLLAGVCYGEFNYTDTT